MLLINLKTNHKDLRPRFWIPHSVIHKSSFCDDSFYPRQAGCLEPLGRVYKHTKCLVSRRLFWFLPSATFAKCHEDIYIYAVKLRTGPIFALFKVKNWSSFSFWFFLKISFSLQTEDGFWKQAKNKKKTHTHLLKLKTGPIMLHNILGPIFNFNLDHILTLEFFSFLLWLKPLSL